MKSQGSYINFRYIFRLFIDWLFRRKKLQPMSDYKIRAFKDYKNLHIFYSRNETSLCGKVKRDSKEDKTFRCDPLTLEDCRDAASEEANKGEMVCGQCVGSLYSDDD